MVHSEMLESGTSMIEKQACFEIKRRRFVCNLTQAFSNLVEISMSSRVGIEFPTCSSRKYNLRPVIPICLESIAVAIGC